MFVGQHGTTHDNALSYTFTHVQLITCTFLPLKLFVVLEKGLLMCAEIGTRLCFRSSFCSSRALQTNQTGQLDKEMHEALIAGCCALWKKKRQTKITCVLSCWTVDIKLILRSRVSVWELLKSSKAAKAWTCITLCMCINFCICSRFGGTSKLSSTAKGCKRSSIN